GSAGQSVGAHVNGFAAPQAPARSHDHTAGRPQTSLSPRATGTGANSDAAPRVTRGPDFQRPRNFDSSPGGHGPRVRAGASIFFGGLALFTREGRWQMWGPRRPVTSRSLIWCQPGRQ